MTDLARLLRKFLHTASPTKARRRWWVTLTRRSRCASRSRSPAS